MNNNEKTPDDIKRFAKAIGLVTNDDIKSLRTSAAVIRRFCYTMSKLELRDEEHGKTIWENREETVLDKAGLEDYLKKVQKSRKKPRR